MDFEPPVINLEIIQYEWIKISLTVTISRDQLKLCKKLLNILVEHTLN